MDYFSLFGLKAEPFSNSPDPDYFFRSRSHGECLNAMEIAVHLRRGLNVVLGEVGTGKSTLCRELVRNLARTPDMETHLLLDPSFASADEFLRILAQMVCTPSLLPKDDASPWQLKEAIKKSLFRRGVDQRRNVVLILDEGQKTSPECLEILRELLNYETNEHKLLQIIIFAQNELEASLRAMPNLADRINSLVRLGPLSLSETRELIRHRLRTAAGTYDAPQVFTRPALALIHRASQGYPRKIIRICHKAMLAAIVANKSRADFAVVRNVLRAEQRLPNHSYSPVFMKSAALTLGMLALLLGYGIWPTTSLHSPIQDTTSPETPSLNKPPRLPAPVPLTSPSEADALATEDFTPKDQPNTLAQSKQGPPVPAPPPLKAEHTGQHLGQLPMAEDTTLSEMIHTIYGSYRISLLRMVAEANPGMENLDKIPARTMLTFPMPPPNSVLRTAFWVRLDNTATLAQAFASARRMQRQGYDVRLLPYQSQGKAMRFAVILHPPFPTREDAEKAARTHSDAEIIRWDANTSLFTATKTPAEFKKSPKRTGADHA